MMRHLCAALLLVCVAVLAGRIYGEWAIGPQDPPGKRCMQVLVGDRPPVVFEYELRQGGASQST